MTPYPADPALHATPPHEPVLDDGFSPPSEAKQPTLGDGIEQSMVRPPASGAPVPGGKSEF